ncbi:MAG: carboxypeptidase regulatory-like domain-containing protein [Chthoniobacteraceae bacterium]
MRWSNDTLNDIPAPLLRVGSTSPVGYSPSDLSLGTRVVFYGSNTHGGPAGILRPGQSESVTFYSFSDSAAGTYHVFVDRDGKDGAQLFDWESMRDQLKPQGMPDAAFAPIFTQLVNQVGPTWGDYLAMLSRNADLMPSAADARNVDTLLDLELRKATAAVGLAITGNVNADTRLGVVGSTLSAENNTTGEAFSSIVLRDGSFIFPAVTLGSYSFRLTGLAVSAPAGPVTVVAGVSVDDLHLDVTRGATLSATIRAAGAGQLLTNASVAIFGPDGSVFSAITDSRGKISVSGLSPGAYRVSVDEVGFARNWADATVTATGAALDVSLAVESHIAGTFQRAPGLSDDDIYVGAMLHGETKNALFFGTLVGNRFQFDGLAAGEYDIVVVAGEAALTVANVTVGNAATVDLGDIGTPAPGALISAPDVVLEAQLAAAKSYLTTVFLPAITARFGLTVGSLWRDFIFSSPSSPTPERFFGDGSAMVEGNIIENGYRDDPQVQRFMDQFLKAAASKIRDKFASGELTCDNFGDSRTFSLAELFDPGMLQLDGALNFSDPFSIPGNTAGGNGSWAPGNRPARPDSRRLSGDVVATLSGKTTLVVESKIKLTVKDAIDFMPGDLGASIERVFTVPLHFLEQHGRAYGVPFVVEFTDKPGRKVTNEIPEQDCDDPDDPPNPDDQHDIPRPVSRDPNDLLGPAGFGADRWLAGSQPIPYTIRFENDELVATAPAQSVRITQDLDPDLDFRTFRVGDFGFGNVFVDVPENRAFYSTRIDLTATRGVFLDVSAGIDVSTGQAFWQFTSIDPATGDVPADPLKGFLPPNVTGPEGEGFVNYTVRPKAATPTGARIDAAATIVFDINAPIDTPAIFNTIDSGLPTSSVQALPSTSVTPTFNVAWTGSDDTNGSAIASFDIYVSDNHAPFALWLSQTTLNSADYTGMRGHDYRFYSVARDNAGNLETPPPGADAATAVLAAPSVDIVDVTPDPRNTGVASVNFAFSRAVTGFSVGDLTLARNGGANLLSGTESLTTTDNITWTLGNLTSLTSTDGTYRLILPASTSGIEDLFGNPLEGDAIDEFVVDATAPSLVSVVSRRIHGAAGTFDINLPLNAGDAAIEPRAGGPNTLVFTFDQPLRAADGTLDGSEVTVTNATYQSAVFAGNTLVLTLSGAADRSIVGVTLQGLSDAAGNSLGAAAGISIRVLTGDPNQSGAVSASDLQGVKDRLTQPVTASNFLFDLNASGSLSVSDLQVVKDNLLHTVPAASPAVTFARTASVDAVIPSGAETSSPVIAVVADPAPASGPFVGPLQTALPASLVPSRLQVAGTLNLSSIVRAAELSPASTARLSRAAIQPATSVASNLILNGTAPLSDASIGSVAELIKASAVFPTRDATTTSLKVYIGIDALTVRGNGSLISRAIDLVPPLPLPGLSADRR